MAPRSLTVLAAIRPGQEHALQSILRAIGGDIKGKRLSPGERPHIDFVRCKRIHFARFAILSDPDRGADCARLLFASVHNGDLESHLAEVIDATSDMDAIWGRCEGYAGTANFGTFVRARMHEPEAFYIAFRDGTVASIRCAVAIRDSLQPLLDAAEARDLGATLARPSLQWRWVRALPRAAGAITRNVIRALQRVLRALPIVFDVVSAVARCGFANVYRGTSKVVASLDRYVVFRLFNRITGNHPTPPTSPYSSVPADNCAPPVPLAPGDEFPSVRTALPPVLREDLVTQNELTLVTVVQPGRVDRVRAVMAAIDSYAKRLAPPGSLIGISTIHFVRWLLIDDGRRLMLLSDYDGSWEAYVDEFAEMILTGLDAIWETSFGYPPDGAQDVPALKRFFRSHQVRSEVFFSAYPEETVLNILDDTTTTAVWADAVAGPLGETLQRG